MAKETRAFSNDGNKKHKKKFQVKQLAQSIHSAGGIYPFVVVYLSASLVQWFFGVIRSAI